MNRICPLEECLSKYLSGTLKGEQHTRLQEHLAECDVCRKLVVEAYEVLTLPDVKNYLRSLGKHILTRKWLIFSILFFILSFIVPGYFFQILSISLVTGIKWAVDSKPGKTLIFIRDAWKNRTQNKQNVS